MAERQVASGYRQVVLVYRLVVSGYRLLRVQDKNTLHKENTGKQTETTTQLQGNSQSKT